MNHDRLFVVNYLIKDTVITRATFIESREVTRQCFRFDLVQIRSQPMGALNDATTNRFI